MYADLRTSCVPHRRMPDPRIALRDVHMPMRHAAIDTGHRSPLRVPDAGRSGTSGPAGDPIDARDRLIVALDLDTIDAARTLVDTLGDLVRVYKIGLALQLA